MSDYFIGEIRMLAIPNGKPPLDWLLCDGAVLNISQYQMLYSLIGTTYGGDGITTFALPDLRGRLPVGQGHGTNLTNRGIAQTFGSEQAIVTPQNLPPHNHTFNTLNVDANTATVSQGVAFANTTSPALGYLKDGLGTSSTAVTLDNESVGNVGGGQGHNNVMPCATVNFVICWQGLYPQRSN
ncbi:phage tail protein [Magnetospirillum fulvum]|uniref:Microcystin dependent MdpB family protein n=1 Tax=Magnetospirillum fulvum MGU-K5 TaxID=1316936 RepID=S9TIA0_MAGFU|nr:tail fiber protein [Magnetospirillum fulvum]EPY01976.1 microcystin dependent MdpB family protein [Magnetospirillum fulvum MGU-K5]